MAIFTKKENTENITDTPIVDDAQVVDNVAVATAEADQESVAMVDVSHNGIGNKGLIIPRTSEKAGMLGPLKQYIFTVLGKVNKVEVRVAIEKMYKVKVERVNMIKVQGKKRRYGRITGKRSGFKKAIVTLTKDSKEINIVEPS